MYKVVILAALLASAYSGATNLRQYSVKPDAAGVLELLDGVLNGFLLDIGAVDIEDCLVDAYDIGDDFYNAIQNFEKKNTAGIVAGLKDVGYALKAIPDSPSLGELQCRVARDAPREEPTHVIS